MSKDATLVDRPRLSTVNVPLQNENIDFGTIVSLYGAASSKPHSTPKAARSLCAILLVGFALSVDPVKMLCLQNNKIGDMGAGKLAEGLPKLTNLKET